MTLKTSVVELERPLSTEWVLDVFHDEPNVGIVTYFHGKRLTKHGTPTCFFSQRC